MRRLHFEQMRLSSGGTQLLPHPQSHKLVNVESGPHSLLLPPVSRAGSGLGIPISAVGTRLLPWRTMCSHPTGLSCSFSRGRGPSKGGTFNKYRTGDSGVDGQTEELLH